jgi:hypothetical protein
MHFSIFLNSVCFRVFPMRNLFSVRIMFDVPALARFFIFLSGAIWRWAKGLFRMSAGKRIFTRFWWFRTWYYLLILALLYLVLLIEMQMRRSSFQRVGLFKVLWLNKNIYDIIWYLYTERTYENQHIRAAKIRIIAHNFAHAPWKSASSI